MRKFLFIALLIAGAGCAAAQTVGNINPAIIPPWLLWTSGVPAPTLDMNFTTAQYYGFYPGNLTVTRSASNAATDLLPTSASGASFQTFTDNTVRITPGLGLLVEEGRTNFLLNSTVPATQTTGSLGTGTYTLWVNGSGSATMSAGTGTGCGTSAASQGSSISFTITIAGTCTVTVSGSLSAFQLEKNPGTVSLGTSLIITAGSTVARAADAITLTSLTFGTAATLYVSAVPQAPSSYGNNQFFAELDDATANNRILLFRISGTGLCDARYTVASSTIYAGTGNLATTGALTKAALAGTNGNQLFSQNGTTISGGTGAGFPTLTQLNIGEVDAGGSSYFNGYVERVAMWNSTKLSQTQLNTLTSGTGP